MTPSSSPGSGCQFGQFMADQRPRYDQKFKKKKRKPQPRPQMKKVKYL